MPDPAYVATIKAGGQNYTSWKSVMVRRDWGDYVSVFQFTASEPGPYGQGYGALRLTPGTPVQVLLGGVQVINGYCTTRNASYDATSHNLVVAGKSLTCDIHDSSVVVQPGSYNGFTFEQAGRGVMAPHPVQLVMSNPPAAATKPFNRLAVQFGETVGEFLERTAKMRGMILCDDKDGNLTAGQGPSSINVVAELQEGRNILRATGKIDDQSLWSRYQIVGQRPDPSSSAPPRDNSATAQGGATRSNRVRVALAEHPGDSDDMVNRANLEAARSTWPCVECQITVAGWFKPDGTLWDVTDHISVYSPMLFPNDTGAMTLGVQAVTYAQDSDNGTTTTLDLVLPQLLGSLQNPLGLATSGAGTDLTAGPGTQQAQPDPPDYSQGSAGPGGLLGHA